jgi:hypothetical protein
MGNKLGPIAFWVDGKAAAKEDNDLYRMAKIFAHFESR